MNKFLLKTEILLAASLLLLTINATAQNAKSEVKEQAMLYVLNHHDEYARETDSGSKWALLLRLTPAAVSAGETGKAKIYAKQLLQVGEELKLHNAFGLSEYQLANHFGNIALGRIAFSEGDIEQAKSRLLASASESDGNAGFLISYGPDMFLAKQLLDKGESETVLQYLQLCSKFWTHDEGKLAKWQAAIKTGNAPNFDRNLSHVANFWYASR